MEIFFSLKISDTISHAFTTEKYFCKNFITNRYPSYGNLKKKEISETTWCCISPSSGVQQALQSSTSWSRWNWGNSLQLEHWSVSLLKPASWHSLKLLFSQETNPSALKWTVKFCKFVAKTRGACSKSAKVGLRRTLFLLSAFSPPPLPPASFYKHIDRQAISYI